ncbi:MAG: HAD-IA family hydrolase [Ilumatobacteraceae bacterium]
MTRPHAPFDTVIFDLDGTVSDSAPGILASLDHAFTTTGYPPPPDLLRVIGPPFETAFRSEGFSPEEITILMTTYRAHYWEIGAFENAIYPGMEELLDELAADGFRIAIGTSKPEPTARRILEHFGYTERFEVIGGATFDMTRATKSAVLRFVLEQLGSARPVMVGDRYHDVEGAAEHNIDCVGVRWGYASTPDELEKAGARWIVEHPKEISGIVRGEVML